MTSFLSSEITTSARRSNMSKVQKESQPRLSSTIQVKKEQFIDTNQQRTTRLEMAPKKHLDSLQFPLSNSVSFTTPDRSSNSLCSSSTSAAATYPRTVTDPRSASGNKYNNGLTASPITSRETSKVAMMNGNERKTPNRNNAMIRLSPPDRTSHSSSDGTETNLQVMKGPSPPPRLNKVTPILDRKLYAPQSVASSVSHAITQTLDDMAKVSSMNKEKKARGTVSRRGGRNGALSPASFGIKTEDQLTATYNEPDMIRNGIKVEESAPLHITTASIPPPRTLSLKPRKFSISSPSLCSSVRSGIHSSTSSGSGMQMDEKNGRSAMNKKKYPQPSADQSMDFNARNQRINEAADSRTPPPSSPLHKDISRQHSSGLNSTKAEEQTKDRVVTFSPVPSHRPYVQLKGGRTPTRSPPPSQQFGDFSGYDDKFSPNPFMSPFFAASPQTYRGSSFEASKAYDVKKSMNTFAANQNDTSCDSQTKDKDGKSTNESRDRSGGATPTNFANDFGKCDLQSSSFDTGNVLSWLQSPTATSLFSPGGIMSHTNTPKGFYATLSRTPRTPTTNVPILSDTDFPQPIDLTSPKPEALNPFSRKTKGSYPNSNLICISPLASKKGAASNNSGMHPPKGTSLSIRRNPAPNTPINLKEVFASPKPPLTQDHESETRTGSSLKDNISKNSDKQHSLNVHMAQRDLYADEDLSVLLQLAETTPHGKSAQKQHSSGGSKRNQLMIGQGPPSSLQLPIMGKSSDLKSSPSKYSQNTGFNDETARSSDDFVPPHLTVRSNSSGSTNHNSHDARQNTSGFHAAKQSHTPRGNAKNNSPTRKDTTENGPPYENHNQGIFQRTPSGSQKKARSPSCPNSVLSPGGPYSSHPPRFASKPPGNAPGSYNRSSHMHHQPPRGGYLPHPHPPPPHQVQNHQPPPYHYQQYPGSQTGRPPYPPMYSNQPGTSNISSNQNSPPKKSQKGKGSKAGGKRAMNDSVSPNKKSKKSSSSKGRKNSKSLGSGQSSALSDPADRKKSAAAISAINKANGNKNDKAAALAAAILRGVTMRPSGKWQAQLYYAGKSRYIGVFDTREKAALAYEIAREKLKSDKIDPNDPTSKSTEAAVNAARRAAFEGVNEKDPRLMK